MRSLWTFVSVALLGTGCFKDSSDGEGSGDETAGCIDGEIDCPCLANDTCFGALVCVNNRCIDENGTETAEGSLDGASASESGSATDGSGSSGSGDGDGDECGNGAVQGQEECDSTPGCLDDCQLEHFECNPITQTDCPGGMCSVGMGSPAFQCLPAGFAGQNAVCSVPEDCSAGFMCMQGGAVEGCADPGGACCTEWCDDDTDCEGANDSCESWWIMMPPGPGLDLLGTCVLP